MSSERADGFPWTLRRLALVPGVYFALVAVVLWYSLRSPEGLGSFNAVTIGVLVLPWLLGVAIALLRRADPVRNWVVPALVSLFMPAALMCYDAHLTLMFSRHENARAVLLALATNTIFIGWYVRFLAKLSPRTCPVCAKRGLIPLSRLWSDDPRTLTTRWCVYCHGKFWLDRQGVWRPERRRTWVDERPNQEGAAAPLIALRAPHATQPSDRDHPSTLGKR